MTSPMKASQEDILGYQKSLDARTEEVFQIMDNTTVRAQANVQTTIEMYGELLDAFKQQGEELKKTRNKYYIASAASCCALIACAVLYFAAECK